MVSVLHRGLVSFIAEENLVGLQHLLDNKKVSVDDRDENGTTALMVAAQRGKLAFVRTLLKYGADVNAEDVDNWTALLFATKEGKEDCVVEVLEHGATVDHRDMGGWTSLMWACYKGRVKAAHVLIAKGADVNAYGNYNVTCLGWAAGRNYVEIVKDLIRHGAKVNAGDKYGTTPLIWAARKGNAEVVEILLSTEASVDAAGMTSWTALLVAAAGNHVEVVKSLLEHKPNVNSLDKDGCSSLTIACKEGYHEIAIALINAGAYININDRGGSSNLIHAAKGGHRTIVEALLKKHADVNVQGKDRKTALYWAVEKSHVAVVKLLMAANPDLELATKDGDTPLMKATRNRNIEIVSLLLEKRAKVSAADKSGDTCLHIAMRARSKQIAELLLRNPVNSQLLYRPNRSGETPYNIDRSSAKPIITQLFGSRGLNTQEDFENLLGYNLYSSALADMLSDPTLNMPISIGLFARWGSGKSFLLGKLKEEMKSFARQWYNPLFTWSPLLFVIIVCLASIIGVICGLSFRSWEAGVSSAAGLVIIVHTFLLIVWFSSQRSKYDWSWSNKLTNYLAAKIDASRLVFQVIFCHPPGSLSNDAIQALPINFYFTEQTKISSTTGGENSVIQMLASLYACLETDYGTFSTRLFRAFRPKPVNAHAPWKWRKLCCIPYCIIFLLCFICTLVSIVVLSLYFIDMDPGDNDTTLKVLMYGCALFVGVLFVANLYTIGQIAKALVFSHLKHLQRTVNKMYAVKSDGFLYALKSEVNLMTDMVQCLDAFTGRQSRMVVIVDGLDSGEQDKVLQVLDAVNILFSDNKAPFIILLAIDPHIISKGIEMNINPVLNDSNVGGQDYLRNLVHLPFYLQNSALRKVKQVKMLESTMKRKIEEDPAPSMLMSIRRPSVESSFGVSLALDRMDKASSKKSRRLGLKMSESIASSIGTNINRVGTGPGDLKKMLLGDDYFSDVNPRSMRRLMNIIHITGRLLKAFNLDFNWHNLSTWVNVTEQWPYRLSWMIIYCEINQKDLEDSMSLKTIFERVKPFIPISKEIDPNVALDRDEKKLDVYLSLHKHTLLVSTLYVFLPFTISLDPQLRKDITEQYQPNEQMFQQSPSAAKSNMLQAPPSPYVPSNYGAALRFRPSGRLSAHNQIPTPAIQQYFPQLISNSLAAGGLYPPLWNMNPLDAMFTPQYDLNAPPAADVVPPKELEGVRLKNLNVEGVANIIESLSSIQRPSVARYQDTIKKHNITGRVLLTCDLNELKSVLDMSFGDWEIFKSGICALRELGDKDEENHVGEMAPAGAVQINISSPDHEHKTGILNMSATKIAEPRKLLKANNPLEKQITMEDQMISGALELLNDDARQDARLGVETSMAGSPNGSAPDEFRGISPLPGILDENETDVLYVMGSASNVIAEIPDSTGALRNRGSFAQISFVSETPLRSGPSSSRFASTEQANHQQPGLESPGKRRVLTKKSSITRNQSLTTPSSMMRKKDEKSRTAQTPDLRDLRQSQQGKTSFHIGGETSTEGSSDESQKPLVCKGTVIMARKNTPSSSRKTPSSPKRRTKESSPIPSRFSAIKASLLNRPYENDKKRVSPQKGQTEAYEMYGTEESSEPAMYFKDQQFRTSERAWIQYRAPTPLPPFGTDEYFRMVKSNNPSPTTSNESEMGSSPQEISSGENLFFPDPPELPESPFPRRTALQAYHANLQMLSIGKHGNRGSSPDSKNKVREEPASQDPHAIVVLDPDQVKVGLDVRPQTEDSGAGPSREQVLQRVESEIDMDVLKSYGYNPNRGEVKSRRRDGKIRGVSVASAGEEYQRHPSQMDRTRSLHSLFDTLLCSKEDSAEQEKLLTSSSRNDRSHTSYLDETVPLVSFASGEGEEDTVSYTSSPQKKSTLKRQTELDAGSSKETTPSRTFKQD